MDDKLTDLASERRAILLVVTHKKKVATDAISDVVKAFLKNNILFLGAAPLCYLISKN